MRSRRLLLVSLCMCSIAACADRPARPSVAPAAAHALPGPDAAREQSPPPPSPPSRVVFTGACDASGAVVLGGSLFAVADDEDNILRVYDAGRGGEPLYLTDVSPALALRKPSEETDIEAGTRIGEIAFWLTSHGTNKKGKKKPARLKFFATTAPAQGTSIEPIGSVYRNLYEDLVAHPPLAPFDLKSAGDKPPKVPGGLNIEGLTEMPGSSSVLIGLRNPVPGGKALVIPLLNPHEIIHGARARLGDPELLDLGGLGIRSLSWWRGRYLIIAGAIDDEAVSRLFAWDGPGTAPELLTLVDLRGLNPEAFATYEDKDRILLFSDDGTVEIDGKPCKSLKDPARKQFRGQWVELPPWQ